MSNNQKGEDELTSVVDKERGLETLQVTVTEVNASGHADQLSRQYGLLSICATALTIDNAWVALGAGITFAVANGGPPGIIYEFLAACFYYIFIAASLSELASSIPSAGGVYHWASATPGPKYGLVFGFFAGATNFFGWLLGLSSVAYIIADALLEMYSLYHLDFVVKPWHSYIIFILVHLICVSSIIFANKYQPFIQLLGLFLIVVGGIVTVVVLAVMPKQHASNSFVWTAWENNTGWPSGVAFWTGMLSGAFAIGTPDSVTHMAEELPYPRRDLPKAIATQITLGTLTGFIYVVALMYGISDLDAVLDHGGFPLGEIYFQATSNKVATVGLLLIVVLTLITGLCGVYITLSRTWWALARDNMVPYSKLFSKVNEKLSCPIPATMLCYVLAHGFGAIQLGSQAAFSDISSGFAVLTTTSYALAIAPHLLSGRSNVPQGPFWMGKWGYGVNALAVLFIIVTNVMYCLPFGLPTTVSTMNYNSVILAGFAVLTTTWWFVHGRTEYAGPRILHLDRDAVGKKIDDAI